MIPKQVALVSLSKSISASDLSQTSAALQKQATRDLGPIWGVEATVDSFPDLKSVPLGYWPIIIMEKLDDPNAAGYHTDKHHQPYSLVLRDATWQLTCSHEMCEMLVDPYGNKLASAGSQDPKQGKVNYLVEVCDPCEDASFAYSINGILVSDFYTPNFFDPQPVPGVRYSYTGAIKAPCQILKNGYISWQDPASGKWFQSTFFGTKPVIKPINGMKNFGTSLRSQMDRLTKNLNSNKAFAIKSKKHSKIQSNVFKSGISSSESWRKELSKYVKPGKHLTEQPILSPANIKVTFKGGNINDDYANISLLDENGNTVDSGKINKNNPDPVHFNNAPIGYQIDVDGYCLSSATIVIDIPTSPDPVSNYGPGLFSPSFDC